MGKKAFAYLEAGAAKDYLLGLACDEVCMPESGWLMLTGLRVEVSFYKDLFDKIGVKADMLQMGDFKGGGRAVHAHQPERAQTASSSQRRLDDYYENGLVARIVQARAGKKLTAEQVKKLIDEGPYTAQAASRPA